MQRSLVIGASGAIGSALASALEERGSTVERLSRSADGFDITDEAGVARGLSKLDGPFDLIFVATGALEIGGEGPEKTIRAISRDAMMDQFALHALGPALVLKHAQDLLPKEGRAVFAALSARVGSIGDNRLGGWVSYRAAKAALNQVVHTAAIELKRTHPDAIAVSLHPGTVRSPLTEAYLGRHPSVTPEESASNLLGVIDRLSPDDSGGFFDWAGKPIPW